MIQRKYVIRKHGIAKKILVVQRLTTPFCSLVRVRVGRRAESREGNVNFTSSKSNRDHSSSTLLPVFVSSHKNYEKDENAINFQNERTISFFDRIQYRQFLLSRRHIH